MAAVVFLDTFQHPQNTQVTVVDQVRFSKPINLREILVCPNGLSIAIKQPNSTSFVGATKPSSFLLDVFAKVGKKFIQVTQEGFSFNELSNSLIVPSQEIITNHLVVRGIYSELSLCIIGDTSQIMTTNTGVSPSRSVPQIESTLSVSLELNDPSKSNSTNNSSTSTNNNTISSTTRTNNAPEINLTEEPEIEEPEVTQLPPWVRPKVADLLYDIHALKLEALSVVRHPPIPMNDQQTTTTSSNVENSFVEICQKAETSISLSKLEESEQQGLVVSGIPSFFLNQLFELLYKERQKHQIEIQKAQQQPELAYFRWKVGLNESILNHWLPKLYDWLSRSLKLTDTNTLETAMFLVSELFLTIDLCSADLFLKGEGLRSLSIILIGNDYSTSLKTKSLDCLAIVLTDTTAVEHYTSYIITVPPEFLNFNNNLDSENNEPPRKKQRSTDQFSYQRNEFLSAQSELHDDGKQATSTRSQFQTPYQLLLTFLTEAQGVLNFRLVNKCQALLLICYVFNELKKFKQRTDQLEMLIQSNRSLSQQRELASQASTSIKRIVQTILDLINYRATSDPIKATLSDVTNPRLFDSKGVDIQPFLIKFFKQFDLLGSILKLIQITGIGKSNLPQTTSILEDSKTTTTFDFSHSSLRVMLFPELRKLLLTLISYRGGCFYLLSSTTEASSVSKIIEHLHPNKESTQTQTHQCSCEELEPLSLIEESRITSGHLAHLILYHLRALTLFDLCLTSIEQRAILVRELHQMCLSAIGRYAISICLGEVDGLSFLTSILSPESETNDSIVLRNTGVAQFGASLLLVVLQNESNIPNVSKFVGTLAPIVVKLLEKGSITGELKIRIQQLNECIKPILALKEQGTVALVNSFKSAIQSMETTTPGISKQDASNLLPILNTLVSLNPNPTLSSIFYASDLQTSLKKIISEFVSLIESSEKDNERSHQLYKREVQHLRLLIPVLTLLKSMIQHIQSAVSEYRNTPLLLSLFQLQTCLSLMPSFYGNLPKSSANGQTLYLQKAQSKLTEVFLVWRWNEVFYKLLDHVFLPKNFVGGLTAFAGMLPKTLPLPYDTAKSAIYTVYQERTRWTLLLESAIDRVSQVISILLHTSDPTLFNSLLNVVTKIGDLSVLLGTEAVVRPILNILSNAETTEENVLCRILSIIFVLCKNPLICAIFQEEDLVSSLLPFLTTQNQRMKGLLLSIVYIMTSVTLSPNISTQQQETEQLPSKESVVRLVTVLFTILSVDNFETTNTVLFILSNMSQYKACADAVLEEDSIEADTLRNFVANLEQKFVESQQSNQPSKELYHSIDLLTKFLTRLAAHNASRTKEVVRWNEAISKLVENCESRNLKEAKILLDFIRRSSDQSDELKQSESVDPMQIDSQQQQQQSIKQQHQEEDNNDEQVEIRSLEDRFSDRIWKERDQGLLFPSEQNFQFLQDSDFFALVSVPEFNPELNQSAEPEKQTTKGGLKRPKIEKKITQYTYGTRSKDVFRTRKPNTSRPPSVHVDEFATKKGAKPSNTNQNNNNSNNNNNNNNNGNNDRNNNNKGNQRSMPPPAKRINNNNNPRGGYDPYDDNKSRSMMPPPSNSYQSNSNQNNYYQNSPVSKQSQNSYGGNRGGYSNSMPPPLSPPPRWPSQNQYDPRFSSGGGGGGYSQPPPRNIQGQGGYYPPQNDFFRKNNKY